MSDQRPPSEGGQRWIIERKNIAYGDQSPRFADTIHGPETPAVEVVATSRESRLREALERIETKPMPPDDHCPVYVHAVREIAHAALADTTPEPEGDDRAAFLGEPGAET